MLDMPSVFRVAALLAAVSPAPLPLRAADVLAGARALSSSGHRREAIQLLETYANYDASFRLIRDGISAPPTDDTIYKLLALNTNIPRSIATPPVKSIRPAN
jgi:hypothetical protein